MKKYKNAKKCQINGQHFTILTILIIKKFKIVLKNQKDANKQKKTNN